MANRTRFDARWQRRRKRARWWHAWKWWLGLAVVLALGWWLSQFVETVGEWEPVAHGFEICGQRGGNAGCVIDGDTIAIGARRIRLTGYDAPELDGACMAERQLAVQARAALRDWLNRAPFLLDGGTDPPLDQYRRELRGARRETTDGQQWLAETMIAAGLGRDNSWGQSARDWCE